MSEMKSQNGKVAWTVAQILLPALLGILAVYGSHKYTSGANEQRLLILEAQIKTNSDSIEKINERVVTREELRLFIDTTRTDLKEIKDDIRAMRK